jgi:hypothetical protein
MILPDAEISPTLVAEHYDELDPFYRALWGEHVHHGYFKTAEQALDLGGRCAADAETCCDDPGAGRRQIDLDVEVPRRASCAGRGSGPPHTRRLHCGRGWPSRAEESLRCKRLGESRARARLPTGGGRGRLCNSVSRQPERGSARG